MRILPPSYTQTPNDLFDFWLPHLGEVELKVLLVIMRKTFGWHKTKDRISISQLEKLTGSCAKHILNSIKSLIEKGVIKKEVEGPNGRQVTYYELVIHDDSNNSYPWPKASGTPGNLPPPTPGNLPGTKETLTKEKYQKKEQQARERAPVVDVVVEKISSSCDEITYISTGGVKKTIDESEIFQHFIKLPYKTETIKQAIEIVREKKEPIGHIFYFLESICKTLEYNASFEVKSSRKDLGETSVQKCTDAPEKLEPNWWKQK